MTTILIARGDVLGDVVLSTTLIEPLKKAYPNASIYLLIKKDYFSLFSNMSLIDGCIEDDLPYSFSFQDSRQLLSMAKHLKSLNIDIFIGAWCHPKYAWLSKLAGIPIRVGHGTSLINTLLYSKTTSFNFLNFFNHQVRWNMALLALLNIDTSNPTVQLDIKPQEKPTYLQHLEHIKHPFITIHLDAGIMQKTLAPSILKSLLTQISQSKIYDLVLVGREHTEALAAMLTSHCPSARIHNLTGKLSLPETADLISKSYCFFGPDSGLAHIAACFHVPSTVYFLNRTQSPLEWAPWQTDLHILTSTHACEDVCRPTICTKMDCREGFNNAAIQHAANTIISPKKHTQNFKQLLLNTGLTLGIITSNASLLKDCQDAGYKCHHLSPKLSIKKLKDMVCKKNINVLINADRLSSIKLNIVRTWASNFIHFKPVIVKASSIDQITALLESFIDLTPPKS